MYRKWKPSRSAKREFAKTMSAIDDFCKAHDIDHSASNDSYYFTINDKNYRVSNHTVEASNSAAIDWTTGVQRRRKYHPEGRREDTIYIHASKTRLIEIYENLEAGYELDGRGYIK